MSTHPKPLSAADWKEIGALVEVREQWGAETIEEFEQMASENIYAAKFDFLSGSPGYVGDLYVLQGDALTDAAPLMLTRDSRGRLGICN